jgi:HSP20 family protein
MSAILEAPAIAREWPCAEIHKTARTFEVEVETPGFEPEDLDVEVEGHTLLVFARPERGHEGAAFSFTFEIPADADLERLRAVFDDGVLKVKAPVSERHARRKLEIERRQVVNPEASGV